MVGGIRPIERHQQRKLALRQPDRTQRIVEAARQRPRRPLHVQAQTIVTNLVRQCEGQFVAC